LLRFLKRIFVADRSMDYFLSERSGTLSGRS
jgi:hypothetical protein